ncbi:MAG: flagellar hook-associated protein FlgK, partial [Phycisphaerales bacterium]|nr:flagellar hook-associated protein FlgK [Phycisphaerales bacterium]
MGLTSSLLIGQSALAASQVALQVTGNNLANVATVGYHRQSIGLSALGGQQIRSGIFVGGGVGVGDIRRQIDPALQARVRDSVASEQAALVNLEVVGHLESVMNELTGVDLSSELIGFFNAFSEMANNPGAGVTGATVVEQGSALAQQIRGMRREFHDLRTQVDNQLRTTVSRADELLTAIAGLNRAITDSEVGDGENGALRDQRDGLIDELSALIDVTVLERESGSVDVLVDWARVVLGGTARGLKLQFQTVNNELRARVVTRTDQEAINVTSGRIGGLLQQREGSINQTIDELDTLASNLIFEVNRRHAIGKSASPLTQVTAQRQVPLANQTLAFNDPDNDTFANLPFSAIDGVLTVTIRDQNGFEASTDIDIDLDGRDSTGAASFDEDMTLEDLRAALDGIANLNAEILPSGQLRLTTDAGYSVSFSEDTSGVLALLGINGYFQGTNSEDIEVSADLMSHPEHLSLGFTPGGNETALSIAELRDDTVAALGGRTLSDAWLSTVGRVGVQGAAAATRAEALGTVRLSLEAQEASIGAVSADEEALNLINYQQQYQGAAR